MPRLIFDKSVCVRQISVVEAHGLLILRKDKGTYMLKSSISVFYINLKFKQYTTSINHFCCYQCTGLCGHHLLDPNAHRTLSFSTPQFISFDSINSIYNQAKL